MFRESGLEELARYMNSPNEEPFCQYGDAAYDVNQYVIGPVKGIRINLEEAGVNREAFLTNCHTCLYSSQPTQYFGIHPPSLEEYINNN